MNQNHWEIHNPDGEARVVVTKVLPGKRWLLRLLKANCRVDVCRRQTVLDKDDLRSAISTQCSGLIGQLTEEWGENLFRRFREAGGKVYSNYAVGYNNIDVDAATRFSIPVGNTPGILTETTAEMAVALTFAAARRLGEAERYLRAGRFTGWLPDLFLGSLLNGKTLGVIGAGRIGCAYAKMMVQGHGLHLVYYNRSSNPELESFIKDYNRFRKQQRIAPVSCRRTNTVEELLEQSDIVGIHTVLNDTTRHMIDARRLRLMKSDAILINTSRGPIIDESALVDHCKRHPEFRAGLDVFENEPDLAEGLNDLKNVVIVPHIASATRWTREGMAILAASNVAGVLAGYPLWKGEDMRPFLGDGPPKAIPSIVNAEALGMHL
jgi:hydroxypyruvate reductase 1